MATIVALVFGVALSGALAAMARRAAKSMAVAVRMRVDDARVTSMPNRLAGIVNNSRISRVLHAFMASVLAWLALRNMWLLAADRTLCATPTFGFALYVLTPLTLLSVSVHLILRWGARRAWDKLDVAILLAEAAAILGVLGCFLV